MEAHATLPAAISTTAITRPTHLKRAISRWEGPAATRWRGRPPGPGPEGSLAGLQSVDVRLGPVVRVGPEVVAELVDPELDAVAVVAVPHHDLDPGDAVAGVVEVHVRVVAGEEVAVLLLREVDAGRGDLLRSGHRCVRGAGRARLRRARQEQDAPEGHRGQQCGEAARDVVHEGTSLFEGRAESPPQPPVPT